jgi:ATP-dependent Zn protease
MKKIKDTYWISQIMEHVSDEDLKTIIEEIYELRQTGILKLENSKLRELSETLEVDENTRGRDFMSLRTAEDSALFEAARRWHDEGLED